MSTTTASAWRLPAGAPAAARTALALLRRLRVGTLVLHLPDHTVARFGPGGAPQAAMTLHDWSVCAAALRSGDIGFAESYIDGGWTTPSLPDLLRLFVANRREIEDAVYGSWLGRLTHRLRHLLNRNSRAGSRRNIHAHYDLGNAFYRLWLDETMNYSSAWFGPAGELPMPQAQWAKVDRALSLAGVCEGSRLLEIGCGWGALAERAARDFGATVTGVTLSTEQLAWGQDRMRQAGVADRVDLRLQDYRDIADGPYDAIVSIEMVEAVGREYWPAYFNAVSRLLRPGGRACIQSIVIDDALFDRYLRSTDFIQQYIFPGGCLPSPQAFREQAAAAGLEVVDAFAFGADYARTLRWWRERFLAARDSVLQLGFDERFIRLWEFYLAYCEAAFDGGNTNVMQWTLQKA